MGVRMPSIDPMFTTRDGSSAVAPASRSGSIRWVRKNTPLTFVSNTLSQPFSGNSASGAPHDTPALFTRMSTWPSLAATAATRASMPSSPDRSAGTEMHSPP